MHQIITAPLNHCSYAPPPHRPTSSLPHRLAAQLAYHPNASLQHCPHCSNATLQHYHIALLPHCPTESLAYWLATPLHFSTVPLPNYTTASLHHYPTAPLMNCPTVPLPYCWTVPLPHFPNAQLPHHLTTSLICFPTALLPNFLTSQRLIYLLTPHPTGSLHPLPHSLIAFTESLLHCSIVPLPLLPTMSLPHGIIDLFNCAIILPNCLTAQLNHCSTTLQLTAPQPYCLTSSPCPLPNCTIATLRCCLTAILPHCHTVPLPNWTAQQHHCSNAALPFFRTVPRHYCLTVPLPYCSQSFAVPELQSYIVPLSPNPTASLFYFLTAPFMTTSIYYNHSAQMSHCYTAILKNSPTVTLPNT